MENLVYSEHYIEPANFSERGKRGYWEGGSKTISRPVVLYVFIKPPAREQGLALLKGQLKEALAVSGEHYTLANNRAIALLLQGNYLQAEEELLKAGLSEDSWVRHNYRVLLKLQETAVVIHK